MYRKAVLPGLTHQFDTEIIRVDKKVWFHQKQPIKNIAKYFIDKICCSGCFDISHSDEVITLCSINDSFILFV